MIYSKNLPELLLSGYMKRFVDRHKICARKCSRNNIESMILSSEFCAIEIRDNFTENYLEIDFIDIDWWHTINGSAVVGACLTLGLQSLGSLQSQKIPLDLNCDIFSSYKKEKAADLFFSLQAFECLLPLIRESNGFRGLMEGNLKEAFINRITPLTPWSRERIENCLGGPIL